ncbi:uncharacterized protein A4U43_C09F5600 [Asparagus officinalis]|uniref:Uncharacterized protein n=1 Tax=Asparagus officinalis TaxID=4686 RepID=A0A5P1E8W7_ASPOF|nr:uncharacterized protein A4U43_C09F5600 [Asparagus officinalis]
MASRMTMCVSKGKKRASTSATIDVTAATAAHVASLAIWRTHPDWRVSTFVRRVQLFSEHWMAGEIDSHVYVGSSLEVAWEGTTLSQP